MRLMIQGRNLEVTDAINDRVHQKIGKVMNDFKDLAVRADVNLSVPRNLKGPAQQISEVTVYASGTVIRAQERHENLYASIDLVADKLTRQLQRYKDKLNNRSQRKQPTKDSISEQLNRTVDVPDLDTTREPNLPETVVRRKFFSMPPMTVQQALDNLQLIDHDFYIFRNIDTDEINVVYERNHGGYGVIQPRKGEATDKT